MEGFHNSVLLEEVLDNLHIKQGVWFIDGTLGDGGHSLGILKRGGKIIGIDADLQALERARNRLQDSGYREEDDFRLIRGNFRDLEKLLQQTETGKEEIGGVLMDLGVSSLQLDAPERGFSFMKDAPLDMRMDSSLTVTAADLINGLNKGELYELFTKLGEEKRAKALAATVVLARSVSPIRTTKELAQLAEKVLGRGGKIHPATKIFQALRIAVNDELNALQEGLEAAKSILNKNGYIVVISFHSLEDRIVKDLFRDWERNGIGISPAKKPILPSTEEVSRNPRSRSAKMRVFKKNI